MNINILFMIDTTVEPWNSVGTIFKWIDQKLKTGEIGQCWFDKKSGLIDKLIKPNFSINKIINGFSMG